RRQPRAQVRQRHPPLRRRPVGDDQERLAAGLGVVPGVEQGLLVMVLGVVEQPAAGLAHENPAEQASARLARPGDQGRHHRPERPAGEMVEGGAIGVGEEEVLLLVGHRPGEGQRDLVQREILNVVPLTTCTVQPCAWSAAWSAAESPTKLTRMIEVPPSARLVVIAEVTPFTRLTETSACWTAPASGVATWTLKVVVAAAGTCAPISSTGATSFSWGGSGG